MNFLRLLLFGIIFACGFSQHTVQADTIIINPYRLVTPAFPYLVNQDFEGAGTPAGWFNNSSDFDYTASPLLDAQSLRLPTDGVYVVYLESGGNLDHSELFVKFRFQIDAFPVSPPYAKMIILSDTSGGESGLVTVLSSGVLSFGAGGNAVATTDSVTIGTPYWMYMRVRSGAGGLGQIAAGFTTTEVRPTSGTKYGYTASNGGVSTTNIRSIGFQTSASMSYIVDNVQVAATIFD